MAITAKTGKKTEERAKRDHVVIDHPKNAETITEKHFTIRVGASECSKVEISIDDQPWHPCRHSVGYWWHDWSGFGPGNHQVVAKLHKKDGEFLISRRRRFKVV